jgi:hypothetical protein
VGRVSNEKKTPPYTLRVMHAVAASSLPSNLRHFLLTLALLADSESGSAYYGQESIGRAMGCSERQVRTYFGELDARAVAGTTPVRITRKRRGRPDGKGRSSDEWTLVLASMAAETSSGSGLPVGDADDADSTGTTLPVGSEPPPAEHEAQPEACDSSSGSLEHLNRKPTSGDRRSDRRSDRQADQSRPLHSAASLGLMAFDGVKEARRL